MHVHRPVEKGSTGRQQGRLVGRPRSVLPSRTSGLRPGRRTVTLEIDHTLLPVPVIHNYGHCGAGITLAWGRADDVTAIVAGSEREQTRMPPSHCIACANTPRANVA